MKFSDKLALKRKANNLSQEQLADAVGVTRQSVSKWESGDSYPDMAKIIQICKVLNCSLNDIIDDEVMGEFKQEERANEPKSDSLKKIFNDLLNGITKSINMFLQMNFKTKLKMIIEMLVVAILLSFICMLVDKTFNMLIWKILAFIPNDNVADGVYNVLSLCLDVIEIIISIVVFLHIYKIRYLDYYITISDKNVSEKTVEEPIEENRGPVFSKEKDPVVIIRDPEHSSSKFIDGLVSVIIFLCKAFLVLMVLPVVCLFLAAVAAFFFCLFKQGVIFKSLLISALGAAILFGIIIVFIYKVIFKQKQNHLINIGLIVIGLVLGGAGAGILTNNLDKLSVINDAHYDNMVNEVIKINQADSYHVFINASNVEYVFDETKEDIEIKFAYPSNVRFYKNEHIYNGIVEYYYSVIDDEHFTITTMIKDFEKNQIHNSYYANDYLYATVYGSTDNIIKHFLEYDY